jgi:hypothetical protein
MYPALSKVLVDFIDKLESEGKLKLWYTSLKNDDGKPSFRVYLQVEDDDEGYTQSKFQAFMEKNQAELGWTGQFTDPNVPNSIPRLREINKACELVLSITKQFPQRNRRQDILFENELKSKANRLLHSVPQEHHLEFIHFIANNLGVTDKLLRKLLQALPH